MRILHVADLHLDHDWFGWVAEQSSAYDLVVIAGDLQNAFSSSGMHDQARAITRWLLGLSSPTIVCTGNHDYWTKDPRFVDDFAEGAWLRQLRGKVPIVGVDGDVVKIGAVRIAIKGWLQSLPPSNGKIDIVIAHAPPAGTPCACDDGGRDNGDPSLWESIEYPPRLMLCGHIHSPRSQHALWPPGEPSTLVLVPGCNEQSEIPAHWSIDLASEVAIHSGGTVLAVPTRLRP